MTNIDEYENEISLIEAAKKDAHAFGQLYQLFVDRIFAYLYRQLGDEALAQDLTAVTFEKALRNLRRYQPQGKSVLAWLYRIARNEMISYHRKQAARAPIATLNRWLKSETNVEHEVVANEDQEILNIALEQLAAKDRELLELKFYESLSGKEIGEMLGYTENNVYVRLHRALVRLRQEITRIKTLKGVEYVSG